MSQRFTTPVQAGGQHRAARTWVPAFAGVEKWVPAFAGVEKGV